MINIIEQIVDQLLDEAQTPANFYVVFNFMPYGDDKELTAKQLYNGMLEGVEGVSDQSSIAMYWLGIARDAMLTMPAQQFMNMNNISKIGYSDPQDLMANNMANLKRLFNNKSPDGVIQRVFEYVFAASKKWKEYADLNYFAQYCAFFQILGYQVKDEGVDFSSPEELAAWVKDGSIRAADKRFGADTSHRETLEAITEDQWLFIINEGLKLLGTVYHSEGEWVINNSTIRIPKFSGLSILKANISDEILATWRGDDERAKKMLHYSGWESALQENDLIDQLVATYQLDRIYKLKYINRKSFDNSRSQYLNKKDNERRAKSAV